MQPDGLNSSLSPVVYNFRLQTTKILNTSIPPFYLDIQDTDKEQILLEVYKPHLTTLK